MAEPTQPSQPIPTWDSNGTLMSAPTSSHQTDGLVWNEIPIADERNWIDRYFGDWLRWLKQFILLIPGTQANTALTITSNTVTPTQGNHTFASSGTVNTINDTNLNPGRLLLLKGTATQATVLANLTGSAPQIQTKDGSNVTLADVTDFILLQLNGAGTIWNEVTRSGGANVNPSDFNARLTLASGVPVTVTDQTAKTTVYLTPYKGTKVALYTGSGWAASVLSEISMAVPATTSTMYDVFIYNNAGTLTLEAVAWSSDTARATALAVQDGIYVKTGTPTHRYVGSFRTTGVSGQVEDSLAKRYLWNYYNRAKRQMRLVGSGSSSWSYTTATWRQADANSANQIECIIGVAENSVQCRLSGVTILNSSAVAAAVGIGLDTTTTPSGNQDGAIVTSSTAQQLQSAYNGIPAEGRHYFAWLEYSDAVGTSNWTLHVILGAGNVALTATLDGELFG